ncbi:MAG: cation transporter [Pseudomonadota bacterium]|uniref:heavy-metal-associated domain-containing protein n=1 Tax=Gallaecimonas pentaromativorans TaxID=584787 RepID=UPI00067F0CDE|nr:cation transporter [Gallaecimonas pentaromativorans]MED5524926.1 cation transporter [Pseudomonadota bacterium]
MTTLRPGVREAYLVRRKLTVSGEQAAARDCAEALDALPGINSVTFSGNRLTLSYDATVANLDALEQAINDFGLGVQRRGLAGIRFGYYRFVDQNIRDNATHEPWCCHRLPPNVKK